MIRVQINSEERTFAPGDLPERWIAQEIGKARESSLPVCVRVHIQSDGLDIGFASAGCGGGGGGRAAQPHETAIIELWREHRLSDREPNPGSVIAFLKQVRNHL